jgi:hypothetical protein
MFEKTFKWIFENRKNIQSQVLIYFLNILHKLFQLKDFMKLLAYTHLEGFVEEILVQLLEEDELSHLNKED